MPVEHLNPEGMHRNPAFSQALVVPPGARLMLIGGQNSVAADGTIVGKGDIAAQTAKALDNLIACLAAGGAGLEHLVKMTILVVGTEDITPAFGAWMVRWGSRPNPPLVTFARVVGLANPDFLIEIEGMAVLP